MFSALSHSSGVLNQHFIPIASTASGSKKRRYAYNETSAVCCAAEPDIVNEITVFCPYTLGHTICSVDMDLGDDVASILLCNETMSMGDAVDDSSSKAKLWNITDVVLRDQEGQTLLDMVQQMKHEFRWLQYYVTYRAVRLKREDEIARIQRMCMEHTETLFYNRMDREKTVVSCVALLDWLIVEDVDFFCTENANRIACFCVMYTVRRNVSDRNRYRTETQVDDMLEFFYDVCCRTVFGETSDIGLAELRFSEERMHERMMAGSYRESGFISLLALYDHLIPDIVQENIVSACYKLSLYDVRYRPSDVYMEFVENFIKMSGCTQTNTKIMFDFTDLEAVL